MTTTKSTEQNVNSKLPEIRDEHQDELTTTDSNLNNSTEYLSPKDLKSDLDLTKKLSTLIENYPLQIHKS